MTHVRLERTCRLSGVASRGRGARISEAAASPLIVSIFNNQLGKLSSGSSPQESSKCLQYYADLARFCSGNCYRSFEPVASLCLFNQTSVIATECVDVHVSSS